MLRLFAASVIALAIPLACAPKAPAPTPIPARVPVPGPFDAAAPMVSAGSTQTEREEGAEGTVPALARDEMKNVPAMGDVPIERFMAAMLALKGAIGADCKDCHRDEEYEKDDFLPKRRARGMIQMSVAINENWFDKQARVTCFTCHRGKWAPEPDPALFDRMRDAKAPLTPLSDEDAAKPAPKVYKNVVSFKTQTAGDLMKSMSMWTAALGVECTYCHAEEGKWEAEDVVQKQVTRAMVELTSTINETWFASDNVVTCWGCHRGVTIPERTAPEPEDAAAVTPPPE